MESCLRGMNHALKTCFARRYGRLPALLTAVVFLLMTALPAQASFVWLNKTSFGANESIIAETGSVSYIGSCPPGGIDDFIYPFADFYIVPRDGYASLSDVSNAQGVPNTIQYLVLDEVLGNTAPGGYVVSGDYEVAIDDCQNGVFDGTDWHGAPFTVRIPANINPIDSAAFAAQIADTKAGALTQSQHWAEAAAHTSALFAAYNAITLLSIATDPADFLLFACTNINLDTGTLYCSLTDAWAGLRKIQQGAVNTLVNQAFYYKGIHADPPDFNYTLLPVLDDGLQVDAAYATPWLQATLAYSEVVSQEQSLAKAMLQALERYQGAQIDGIGEYAWVQARQVEDYARQLIEIVPRTIDAFETVVTLANASGVDFVSIMNDYRTSQLRVATSGLTAVERTRLESAGWSDQQINDGITDYLDRDFSGLQSATDLSDLLAGLDADAVAWVDALSDLADAMAAEQALLAAQLRLPFPDAMAGGPYTADEGDTLTLNGTATSHPDLANSQLAFDWDLDMDGEFDDASGETALVNLSRETDGYVGLLVSAPTGYKDVSYARLTINDVNLAPEITTTSPASPVTMAHDGSVTFSAAASDPEGAAISYAWDLDGTAMGGGTSFTFNATMPDVGEHVVTLTVSDGSPLSADVQAFWIVVVEAPDSDGDGYAANLDCDDGNPDVNPGETEVYYNGLDDDCDPATPDNPDADGDTYDYTVDCDDADPAVNPGATEICNLVDDNCNGAIDEGFDLDGDGIASCAGDCDDTDPDRFPGNPEICDLKDNDCDGSVDQGLDADGDGITVCAGDCNDGEPAIYPGAVEVCNTIDDNCNGAVDEGFDVDDDGVTTCAGDCDDTNPLTYPGAVEQCDSEDNNCNGTVDEGVTDDFDGDTFAPCDGDCNDGDTDIYPNAPELCDLKDNDCDGDVDEGLDADGDGITPCSGDCDDTNPQVYPGHPEIFHDGVDNDCDGATLDNWAGTFLIATDDNSYIYQIPSNGDGTFGTMRQITRLAGYIRGAALADFDNDGDLDVVVGSPSGNNISFWMLRNDGSDNLVQEAIVGSGTNAGSYQMDMTVGDYNHDGNMDFISDTNGRYVHYAFGDGSGGFLISTVDLGIGNGRGMDSADFNHDGHLDYVRTSYSSGQIRLFLGDGTGSFTDAGVVGDPGVDPYGATAADFNSDGHPDVIANYGGNGDSYFYAGNGDGTFAAGVYIATLDHNNHGAFDSYDFNSDGHQDFIASSYSSRKIYYYPGNGDGTFGARVTLNPTNTSGNTLGIAAPPDQSPAASPVAFIDPNVATSAPGSPLSLSAQFSYDDSSIVSYQWDFGDGTTAAGENVTHTYSEEKARVVTLTVTDDEGKSAVAASQVSVIGGPPTADAGGPYTFDEAFAAAGIFTVPLDGTGSGDDGPTPLIYEWNLGNGLNEDFSDPTISPGLWQLSADVTLVDEEAQVTGVGGWSNRYLVTKNIYNRNDHPSYRARVWLEGGSRSFMWGLKNTGENYHYNQFYYAIYINNNGLYIYESGGSRGGFGTVANNTSYDLRIDLRDGFGADYYIRETGAADWNHFYASGHSAASDVRLGVTVFSGASRFDDFQTAQETSTSDQPTVTYPGLGTYTVSLTVTDDVGQSDTDTTAVSLVPGAPPVADAGGPYLLDETSANCDQWTVTVDGSGSSDDVGIYSYLWDFGDGTTGTGATATHVYNGAGTYIVTLTVMDHAFQTHTVTTTVQTTAGAPPVAQPGGAYSVDESAANAGLWTVNLNGNGSTDDTGICDYAWDFGDGATGTGAASTHDYGAAGTYTVTLTVRDHALQSHSATTTVTVTANDPPAADAGGIYAVDEGQAQGGTWTASFDASGSSDDFGIWSYAWDFGDGNTGTGATPTHTYSTPGTYDVTLTVTDNGQQQTVVTTQITVGGNEPPVADAGPSFVIETGQSVTLDATGSTDDFGIFKYEWDLDLPPFSEAFVGGLDTSKWSGSGAAVSGGEAVITGANNWGNRYLVSTALFNRQAGDSYTGRIMVEGGTSPRVMWGLKNTSANYSYTQFYYAIYYYFNDLYIYESGANRGTWATGLSNDTSYDLRIDVKTSGATYYYRETGAANWEQLYDSGYSNAGTFRLGSTIYAGVTHLDDFTGALPNGNKTTWPEITVAYETAGTYQPTMTVTDNALQTDSDSAVVEVVLGSPPVADAGGAYLTQEDIPTRFNARSSSDDFGIEWYHFDFGDGEDLLTRNPWVDHRYLAAGTYTLVLTVTDFAGQTDSDSVTVTVTDDPVVAAVPWQFSGGIEVPHDTWSGRSVRLKAVAYSLNEPLTYTWDFGDGSAPVSGTAANRRAIEADHVYTGLDGRPFIATVTVTDSLGQSASDEFLIRVRPKSLDIEINVAIDDGLWFLHKGQVLGEFAAGTYGNARIEHGRWDNSNGYGGNRYHVAPTSSGVQAFLINGHLELGDVRQDPYVDTVARAMRYLPHSLRTVAVTTQPMGDPDTNSNGLGIETGISNDFRHPYEVGQAMDAFIATGSQSTFAYTGGSGLLHHDYRTLVQDMVDAYAYGQTDTGSGRGGWRYSWNGGSDNSVAGWAAIGLIPAERLWNLPIPDFVKPENNDWLTRSYNGTGFGYSGPGNGNDTTAAGMVQLAMVGAVGHDDPNTAEDERDPRWATAEDYIANQWSNAFWFRNLNNANRFSYYAYYNFTKAMRLANPAPIVNLGATGLDWFKDDVDGIARRLVTRQEANGGWTKDGDPGNYVGNDLVNAWSIIMLTPTLFVQPPVADAGPDRIWGVDVPLTLDGSGSFHLDPFRDIVLYEWDVDGDGVFDTSSTDPTVITTYAETDYPNLPTNVTVTLRVTDNNAQPTFDTDTAVITIAIPPHPPIADAGGSYTATADIPFNLDGSGSFDIDPTDVITSWEWDLDNDGQFDDAVGVAPEVTFDTPGIKNVGLRVLDNAVLNDVDGDGVQDPEERLEGFDLEATVTVVANEAPVADANGPYQIDEGTTFTLDGTGSSDPNNDPLTFSWDLDDDGQFDDAAGATPSVSFADDGVYPVSLQVSDSLLTDEDQSTVTVLNVAPAVEAGPDQTVNEGDTVAFAGSFTDPGTADTHTIVWDFGDGSPTVNGTLTPTHVYADDGNYTVTLTVTDDDGGVGSDTLTVTVLNVAPSVDAGPDQSVLVDETVTFAGSFTDPGTVDTHTIVWDFGDGSTPTGGTLTPTHVFTAAGTYTVTLTVTDDDGGVGSDTLTVTVDLGNQAPLADANGPYQVNEGTTFNLDATGSSDPDGDALTFNWDLDNDGQFDDATGPTPDVTFADDGFYPVAVQVSDGEFTDVAQSTVTVLNVAPIVDAGPDQSVNDGDTVVFAGDFTDPGTEDTHTIVWDFGDGAAPVSGTLTPSHVFTTAGTYIVTLTVTDDDGGVGSDTMTVMVDLGNQAPAADANGPYQVNEGTTFNLDATGSSDPDGDALTFNWDLDNDGQFDDDTGPTPDVTFADDGFYPVAVQVSDGEFTDVAQSTVTVLNVAPLVDAGPDQTVDEGDTVAFAGGFTDPGTADTHTIVWDFGDGSPTVSGTLTPTHAYVDDGIYTVTLTVTDDDGGVGSDTLTVTVQNVAPLVDAGPDQTVDVNDEVVFAGSFTDPGTADTHVISWDFGDGTPAVTGTLTPMHEYADDGTYTVTLTVTDDDGGVGTDTLTVTVEAGSVPVQTIFDLYARAKATRGAKIQTVWSPVDGADCYNVYRSTTSGGPYMQIVNCHVTSYSTYLDYDVVVDTTYYYVVRSVTNGVESLNSNEVSATPRLRVRTR